MLTHDFTPNLTLNPCFWWGSELKFGSAYTSTTLGHCCERCYSRSQVCPEWWEVYACSILIEHRHQESVFLSPTRLLIRTASRRIKCRVRARTLSRCLVDEVIRVLVTKKHKIESRFANFGVFVTWTRVLTSSTTKNKTERRIVTKNCASFAPIFVSFVSLFLFLVAFQFELKCGTLKNSSLRLNSTRWTHFSSCPANGIGLRVTFLVSLRATTRALYTHTHCPSSPSLARQ